jgi:hypothetical protein
MKIELAQDQCLVSLALECETSLEELSSANEALLEQRQLGNSIVTGDEVILPDESTTGVTLKLNQHHVISITPIMFQLPFRLVNEQFEPISGVEVTLAYLGATQALKKNTDADGIVRFKLPLSCEKGLITYQHNDRRVVRTFYLGKLLPPNWESGKKQRLNNLSGEARLNLQSPEPMGTEVIQALAVETGKTEQEIDDWLTGQLA